MADGTIVKAAPTYKPQILTSHTRLLSMLKNSELQGRVWCSHGYIIGLARIPKEVRKQTGPRAHFLSASRDANVVGNTASHLLEIDEAQDVSVEKFNTDLKPMGATTNCTTVLYGTARSEDTLLAQVTATNKELEELDGIRRHFEYGWRTLAAINPQYAAFVKEEIKRLGKEHATIRTQYCLETISEASFLLSKRQRQMLRGSYDWLDSPDEGYYYVAGIDVGGEARPGQAPRKRASTVMTIAGVTWSWDDLDLPTLYIVHQVEWSGKPVLSLYSECVALCERWEIRNLVIDKTGLGEGLTSLLLSKLGAERVEPFHFTRHSKSKLTYQFLHFIDSGRLKMYTDESAPEEIRTEVWKQLELARYRVPAENLIDMYVPPNEGHDDYLTSMALCCEAANKRPAPCFDSIWIPPKPLLYPGEGRY